MNLSQFDTVEIYVKTTFGVVSVVFTIIDVINEKNKIYALVAQHRVVVGQLLVGDNWKLSESIDLIDIEPLQNVLHKGVF